MIATHHCAVLLCMATGFVSCTTVKERFHLKATQEREIEITVPDPERSGETKTRTKKITTTNYYRITINAWTLWSASQYSAGWYDKEAVDSLFGELKGPGKIVGVDRTKLRGHPERSQQPEVPEDDENPGNPDTTEDTDDGETAEASGSPQENESESVAESTIQTTDGQDLADKRLVIFLSTNADSLVSRISAFSKSAAIQQSLIGMILAPELERLADARLKREIARDEAVVLAAELTSTAAAIRPPAQGDPPGPEAVSAQLVRALKLLAQSGNDTSGWASIVNAAAADAWRVSHPDAFRMRGGR